MDYISKKEKQKETRTGNVLKYIIIISFIVGGITTVFVVMMGFYGIIDFLLSTFPGSFFFIIGF